MQTRGPGSRPRTRPAAAAGDQHGHDVLWLGLHPWRCVIKAVIADAFRRIWTAFEANHRRPGFARSVARHTPAAPVRAARQPHRKARLAWLCRPRLPPRVRHRSRTRGAPTWRRGDRRFHRLAWGDHRRRTRQRRLRGILRCGPRNSHGSAHPTVVAGLLARNRTFYLLGGARLPGGRWSWRSSRLRCSPSASPPLFEVNRLFGTPVLNPLRSTTSAP